MTPLDAPAYLQRLHEVLMGTTVTDAAQQRLDLAEGTARAMNLLLRTGASGKKVMLVGNGGSAAIVSHMQNDLAKAVGVPALVFTEQPLLTALGNDLGYGSVYEKPVELWARAGDALVAVSSSGQSDNILRAVRAAKLRGCDVVTFSGFKADNPLRRLGDLNFYTASSAYGHVEVAHQALTHCITDAMVARTSKEGPA